MGSATALVTGATGAIGPTLVSQLLANGYIVRTYGRTFPPPWLLELGIVHYSGSITDANALALALKGVDTVFHLAALLHIENPSPTLTSEYHRVNVVGGKTIAEGSARATARQVIYFSTVKVYGIRQRLPVKEAYPTVPKTIYARTKLEGEQAIKGAEGIESTVLRLSPVYGPV